MGFNDITFLRDRVFAGARERWQDIDAKQRSQLEHELRVIGNLGFAGFFLVMWDAVDFARKKGILCQGRGSAANSAVAYCLAITAVDPVKHGLLFERFLSEIRVDGQTEAPDIDVDIEHDRREEVLDYVYDKYNRSNAAITCIVQMYRGPNAILDSMRAFGYPVEMATNFSKRIHWSDPAEGAKYIEETLAPKFGLDLDNPRGKATLAAMAAFEGVPRLRSTHVGGFVLSSAPLGDYLPVEHTTMGRTIIQFDKDDLDAVGIPKFDFLGLGALSLVRRSFDMIEVRTGTRPEMYKLPQDDEETYKLIAHGETDRFCATYEARSIVRHRGAGGAHTSRSDPGEFRPSIYCTAARTRARDVPASRSGADPQADPGNSDFPGAGDGDRHEARRLLGGAGG